MAAPSATSAAVIGSTGLVGSNILKTLLADTSPAAFTPVTTITRRAPNAAGSPHLNAIVDEDNSTWAAKLSALHPVPGAVFSALGTTRAQAGGLQNQWKIDHDLNIELAKAAKSAGTRTFVFVSSAGTRSFLASSSPYAKMKNGVEDAVKGLDFDNAVILKPGMILGQREHSRMVEGLAQTVVKGIGAVSHAVRDNLGQDAEVIGRAAVRAAQLASEGKAPSKYWVLEQAEIIKLGRTEWHGETNGETKAVEAKAQEVKAEEAKPEEVKPAAQ